MTQPTIDVWPRLGTTVTLESGYVITASGAEALATDEILGLLRKYKLLTFDPTFVNPNPSPIPPVPGGGGGGATAASIAALGLLPGVTSGLQCYCQGYRALGDGGEGSFYWVQGDLAPANGGTIVAAAGGNWYRELDAPRYRNAKWFGAYGDGTHDDTAAIQAAIDSAGSFGYGADVFIPAGTYKITSTLRWQFGGVQPWFNGRLRGENAGGKTFGGTVLKWAGPTLNPYGYSTAATGFEPLTNGSVMFQISASDSIVEHLQFQVAAGFKCGTLVNLGFDQGASTQALSQIQFKNCQLSGGATLATGTADYCITWDYWKNATDENTEDCRILDCGLGSVQIAVFWFRLTTQPYGTVFQRCFMINGGMVPSAPGYTGNEPYGSCFKNDTLSLSLTVQDCDIQRFACIFFINTHPQQIKVTNCHCEATKKIWYSNSGSFQDISTCNFDSGRYSTDGVAVQSYGADTSWGPTDYAMFSFRGDHPASIQNCNFQSTFTSLPFTIYTRGNDLFSANNRYPNASPFSRLYPYDVSHIGRTYSAGDTGTSGGGLAVPLPVLRGCANGAGTVTISGATTSAAVVFAIPEPALDMFGVPIAQNYKVTLSVQTVTGTPVVTAPYISGYLSTGFTVNLPTAPGIGNSITIAYEPWRA